MNKVYNKINDVVNGFYDFFKNFSSSKNSFKFYAKIFYILL